eukprot:TRINITY_DN850_c1_g1_i1.p1 TRINITY_DN850_c1_g1~~TRINITY_DN850_c1_g1_i1.p1  ORF type:complete len:702 (+),score=195.31 TRINITY_DN850_c1_g1_i1:187-2292(+)
MPPFRLFPRNVTARRPQAPPALRQVKKKAAGTDPPAATTFVVERPRRTAGVKQEWALDPARGGGGAAADPEKVWTAGSSWAAANTLWAFAKAGVLHRGAFLALAEHAWQAGFQCEPLPAVAGAPHGRGPSPAALRARSDLPAAAVRDAATIAWALGCLAPRGGSGEAAALRDAAAWAERYIAVVAAAAAPAAADVRQALMAAAKLHARAAFGAAAGRALAGGSHGDLGVQAYMLWLMQLHPEVADPGAVGRAARGWAARSDGFVAWLRRPGVAAGVKEWAAGRNEPLPQGREREERGRELMAKGGVPVELTHMLRTAAVVDSILSLEAAAGALSKAALQVLVGYANALDALAGGDDDGDAAASPPLRLLAPATVRAVRTAVHAAVETRPSAGRRARRDPSPHAPAAVAAARRLTARAPAEHVPLKDSVALCSDLAKYPRAVDTALPGPWVRAVVARAADDPALSPRQCLVCLMGTARAGVADCAPLWAKAVRFLSAPPRGGAAGLHAHLPQVVWAAGTARQTSRRLWHACLTALAAPRGRAWAAAGAQDVAMLMRGCERGGIVQGGMHGMLPQGVCDAAWRHITSSGVLRRLTGEQLGNVVRATVNMGGIPSDLRPAVAGRVGALLADGAARPKVVFALMDGARGAALLPLVDAAALQAVRAALSAPTTPRGGFTPEERQALAAMLEDRGALSPASSSEAA